MKEKMIFFFLFDFTATQPKNHVVDRVFFLPQARRELQDVGGDRLFPQVVKHLTKDLLNL
jgi:hypothetical protein